MLRKSAAVLGVLALFATSSLGAETTPQAAAAPPGRALYMTECAGCHGADGDGKGQADPALVRHPRDFTRGKFRFRSTDSGKAVSNDELLHTITDGIPGSAMPSFRYLSDAERRTLVGYVRYLARLDGVEVGAAVYVPDPPHSSPALIAEGKDLYTSLGCPICHGPAAKGDGAAASALKDETGAADPPPDLTRTPLPGGSSAKDVYLRLTLGVPGTPMPGFGEAITEAQRWAVVAYLESLRQPPPTPPSDPVARGKIVIEEYQCLACHQLKGAGGQVGPALDAAATKLKPAALRAYIKDPRAPAPSSDGARMPQQFLQPAEIDAVVAYLTAVAAPPSHQ